MNTKLKQLLTLSILLNVLLIGILIGAVINRVKPPAHHDHPPMPPMSRNLLSTESQKLFDQTMKKVFEKNRELNPQFELHRKRVFDILRAKEFSANDYQQAVHELSKLHNLELINYVSGTIELAEQFDQKERGILADILKPPPNSKRGPGTLSPPPPR